MSIHDANQTSSYHHPRLQPAARHVPPPPVTALSFGASETTHQIIRKPVQPRQSVSNAPSNASSVKDVPNPQIRSSQQTPPLSQPAPHIDHTPTFQDILSTPEPNPQQPAQSRFSFRSILQPSEQRLAEKQRRKERRAQAREKAQEYKAEKRAKRQQERLRNHWLGGIAYGFDPGAGLRSSASMDRYGPNHKSTNNGSGTDLEEKGRGRSTARHVRDDHDQTWGIESGGPGKEGKYRHGYIKNRDGHGGDPNSDARPTRLRSISPWRAPSQQQKVSFL